MSQLVLAGIIIVGVIILFSVIPVNLWITAQFTGVRVNLFSLLFMRIRKVPPGLVVRSMILATKAGIEGITIPKLEAHYLAAGNIANVINALIVADKANLNMDFNQAAAIDLAGRDVLQAVQVSVTPYIIKVPPVSAVSLDGIQLVAETIVTVRTNIQQLVGGAGEETIKARIGQGVISRIGMAASFMEILESPDHISKQVLANGLDAGTAFEILSIDIADISVDKNIGARLQIDQAMADLDVANAKAEERRAMAVAHEQEMIARAQEAKAKVILAEAEIPTALSDALRKGRLFKGMNPD